MGGVFEPQCHGRNSNVERKRRPDPEQRRAGEPSRPTSVSSLTSRCLSFHEFSWVCLL